MLLLFLASKLLCYISVPKSLYLIVSRSLHVRASQVPFKDVVTVVKVI